MNAPLILILAASIGSVPVTPGCLATAARTREDSENGATTSRSACFRPRSGATGTDLAAGRWCSRWPRHGRRAPGWACRCRPPPSMGTTGPVIFDGAGLVRGTAEAAAPAAAGLPPAVASTAPVAVPATTSTLTSTGTRRLGREDDRRAACAIRRQRRLPASASECIGPNITPRDTVPGECNPGQGSGGPGPGVTERGGAARHGAGRARVSRSWAGVVTGAWQVNWRQT